MPLNEELAEVLLRSHNSLRSCNIAVQTHLYK